MSDKPESMWKGRPLSELSRGELIEALEEMGATMWQATLRRQAEDAMLRAARRN